MDNSGCIGCVESKTYINFRHFNRKQIIVMSEKGTLKQLSGNFETVTELAIRSFHQLNRVHFDKKRARLKQKPFY